MKINTSNSQHSPICGYLKLQIRAILREGISFNKLGSTPQVCRMIPNNKSLKRKRKNEEENQESSLTIFPPNTPCAANPPVDLSLPPNTPCATNLPVSIATMGSVKGEAGASVPPVFLLLCEQDSCAFLGGGGDVQAGKSCGKGERVTQKGCRKKERGRGTIADEWGKKENDGGREREREKSDRKGLGRQEEAKAGVMGCPFPVNSIQVLTCSNIIHDV